MTDSPAYSFGSRFKEPKLRSSTPGPGQYSVDSKTTFTANTNGYNTTKKFAFGLKLNNERSKKKNNNNSSPGPGAYKVNARKSDGPEYSFGRKAYLKVENSPRKFTSPGPGTYRPGDSISPRVTSTPRMKADYHNNKSRKNQNSTPGPGNYNLGNTFKADKGWSIGGKLNNNNNKRGAGSAGRDNSTPGPAAYSPEKCHITEPHVKGGTFGMIVDPSRSNKHSASNLRNSTPGPGNYLPVSPNLYKKCAPIVSMSPRLEDKSAAKYMQSIPGPGTYDISKTLSHGISYSMSPRLKERKPDNCDVPYYYPNRTARGAAASIGRHEWGQGI